VNTSAKKNAAAFIIFLAVICSTSCNKDDLNTHVIPSPNQQSPVANAGADRLVSFPNNHLILDGSASVDNGLAIQSYRWNKVSGPDSFSIQNLTGLGLNNPSLQKVLVSRLLVGTYQFELTVKNVSGLASKDTVAVTYDAPSSELVKTFHSVAGWVKDDINAKVSMETASMPAGYTVDRVSKVYLYQTGFFEPIGNWVEIKKEGVNPGRSFYYKFDEDRIVVYSFYTAYNPGLYYLTSPSVLVLFQ